MTRFDSPVYAILGPTCSGKTRMAIALAQQCGGEVVSCDSMQVYRQLSIGTAKPPIRERRNVPHHLLDMLDMRERFDAHRFRLRAEAAIRDIQKRGRTAIVAGGSGMYAKALIYNLPLLPSDEELLQRLTAESETPEGLDRLQHEAAVRDPGAAETLRSNPRRLARAVEVLRLTGKLPAELHRDCASGAADPAFRQAVILPEPAVHKAWIRQRTEAMLQEGWIDEVRRLKQEGLFSTPTAQQALGYRDIAEWLCHHPGPVGGGKQTELAHVVSQRTWQFARRQRTWFRHQHPGAVHVTGTSPEAILHELLSWARMNQA